MTKKHFIALAAIIAATSCPLERKRLCEEVGAIGAGCNREFKWGRWRDACGVSQ